MESSPKRTTILKFVTKGKGFESVPDTTTKNNNNNNNNNMDSSSPAMQSTNTSSPNITNLSSRPPANTSSPANNNTINLIDNDINMDDDIQTTTSTTSTTSTTNNSTNNNNNNNAKQPSTPSTPTVVPPRRAAPPPLDENADETDDDLLLDEYPSDEDDEIYPEDAKSRRGGGHNQNHQQQTSPQGDKVARQIKRVRKYADEEEEQNQQALGTPNQLGQTPQTPQTPGASGDRPAPNGRGRPKKYVPQDEEDDPNDPNNEKKKKSKKTPPNTLDIRPCWFAGCTKADRSLKILRPCLIPTCKTHAIKSESRIYDALGKGFCLEEQGQKDTVCGICGESNKPLSHCANDECAFGYCPPCTEIIVSKHGNQPGRPGWMCWVCNFVKIRGKERERTRWVREVSQPNSYTPGPRKQRVPKAAPEGNTSGGNEGTPSLTGKRQRKGKQNMAGMEGEYDLAATAAPGGSGTPNNNAAPAPAKRGRKRLYNADQGQADTTSVPASPEQGENGEFVYHSIMSPERESLGPIDSFIEAAFNSIKFFNSILKNQNDDNLAEHFNGLVTMISRLRTIRWSNDYQMVWSAIEELGMLFKRNLESSQTILSMQGEIKELTDGAIRDTNNGNRNLPLERAISRVFEHHELSNRIEKECTATRSILVIAIDNAMKAVEEMQARLRLTFDEDTKKEVRISHELVSLEEQLSKTIVDVQRLKNQEDELVEKLSAVRNQLATVDGHREALSKRCSDLKIEALLSKNELAESELNAKVKEATLDNEMNALHSLIGLIEGVFWGHEYFYCTEIGECEKAISEKLASHNEKITFKNDIPLASALKSGIQIQSLKELQPNNNNVLATNTSANGDVSAGGETEGSDDVVSFVNPFKTLCIYHNACMEHNVPDFHLEKPDRIRVAVSTIQEFVNRYPGIVEIFNTPPEIEQRYVMAVHDAHYIRKLETSLPPENSDYETHLESDNTGAAVAVTQKEGEDDEIYDTFLSHRSMKAALRAAGAVCSAVDSVTKYGYHRTFCAVRPPGHHAGRYGRTADAPSQGYCLINNVAIGAKYASLTYGYQRIAVVDFDVHHGNGTQEILSGDDNFLFISIHVCDEKRYFYPGTGKDYSEMREDGSSEDNILNVGLKRNSGSNTFLQAWTKKIIPRLEAYKPQLIFLSAGFDGHKDDPTNGLKLVEEDYYTITKMIKEVAAKYSRGRIISVLEGGYGIERTNSLQRCLNMHLKALVEDSNSEILFNQAASGDFSLIKKLYNGSAVSTIRDPNKVGDIESLNYYDSISKDFQKEKAAEQERFEQHLNTTSSQLPSSSPASPSDGNNINNTSVNSNATDREMTDVTTTSTTSTTTNNNNNTTDQQQTNTTQENANNNNGNDSNVLNTSSPISNDQ